MDKKLFKKTFWPVFIIVFIIVAVFIGKSVYNAVYESEAKKAMEKQGIDVGGLSSEEIKEMAGSEKPEVKVTDEPFVCGNDNSVQSRVYVYLHGLGDHNKGAFDYQRSLIKNDPKTKDILDFDYNEESSLSEISGDFVSEFNNFVSKNNPEEVIIIGQSAGGVIASFSAHKLKSNGIIELHTLASPLNGYHVSGSFLRDTAGFAREIGSGFDPFATPPGNVKAYHHKTVEDDSLRSWCKGYASYCDPLNIQDNNLEGGREVFYPEHDHETIMPAVSKLIIECHK